MANMMAYSGKVDDAIEVYAEVESRFGLSEEVAIQQFGLLMENRRPKEAEALVKRAIAANPEDPRYEALLAELYDQQGDHEEGTGTVPEGLGLGSQTACCASPLLTLQHRQDGRGLPTSWAGLSGPGPRHRCQDAGAHRLLLK
ncbi:MAG: tetratricopeptide repeat protein [Flavobacteriales bacterium]